MREHGHNRASIESSLGVTEPTIEPSRTYRASIEPTSPSFSLFLTNLAENAVHNCYEHKMFGPFAILCSKHLMCRALPGGDRPCPWFWYKLEENTSSFRIWHQHYLIFTHGQKWHFLKNMPVVSSFDIGRWKLIDVNAKLCSLYYSR